MLLSLWLRLFDGRFASRQPMCQARMRLSSSGAELLVAGRQFRWYCQERFIDYWFRHFEVTIDIDYFLILFLLIIYLADIGQADTDDYMICFIGWLAFWADISVIYAITLADIVLLLSIFLAFFHSCWLSILASFSFLTLYWIFHWIGHC